MHNYEQTRPEYDLCLPKWQQVEDCVALGVKQKDWAYARRITTSTSNATMLNDYINNKVYLPYPSSIDDELNLSRYYRYLQRAIFTAYTKRTHDGFLGMVYRKEPVIELPDSIEAWSEDATGTGLNLTQVSKSVLSAAAKTGRCGIYVSYPMASDDMTEEQTRSMMPTVSVYTAEDIINWSDDDSLIVLRECYDSQEDEFAHETEYQYRVLRLRPEGATSQLYRNGEAYEETLLIDGSGARFNYIPFHWVGTVNNDNHIDESLLEGISDLNIGHYRNSADLEENSFLNGQGTLFISSDMPVEDFQRANPNGVEVGANKGHFIGSGGSATLLQLDANQITDQLMKRKEEQMIQIGAVMITQQTYNSATEANIAASTESANLISLTENVESAMRLAIIDSARYMGLQLAEDQFTFDLNREFYPATIDPSLASAMIMMYDRGVIGNDELREPLRKQNLITRDDEEIDEETANRGIA